MSYKEAIDYYMGREAIPSVDYLLQDDSDGGGIYFKFWSVSDKPQPTIQELDVIVANISFALQFEELRKEITRLQIEKQKEPMLLASKFVLNCSDDTVDLILKAKSALWGSGRYETRLVDYQGNPNNLTIDDIDIMVGNPDKGIVGEISVRRLDLHEQEITLLEKILLGQPYTIQFV